MDKGVVENLKEEEERAEKEQPDINGALRGSLCVSRRNGADAGSRHVLRCVDGGGCFLAAGRRRGAVRKLEGMRWKKR